jgi:beta-barrel assembly-enhancing protease
VRNAINSVRVRLLAGVMVLGLAQGALAGTNAYDKYRNVSYSNQGLMSEADEMRIGAQVHQQQVLQKYRLVEDPDVTGYVEQLGRRVAQSSERSGLEYRFFVVDDPSVNAFSIPGGYIYVNTGLLRLVGTEDELAAVLAHEIGHVVARHGLRNLKSAQRAQVGVGIATILGSVLTGGAGGRAIGTGAQVFAAGRLTRFSRDFEREADYLGLYNTAEAGFDPNGMVGIFQKLGRSGSNSQIGGIFASHPDSGERVKNTQAELSEHLRRGVTASGRRALGARRAGGSYASFDNMKQALAAYGSNRNSTYGQRRRDGRSGNDPYDRRGGQDPYGRDPYGRDQDRDPRYGDRPADQDDPGPYSPPPMRRRTPQP